MLAAWEQYALRLELGELLVSVMPLARAAGYPATHPGGNQSNHETWDFGNSVGQDRWDQKCLQVISPGTSFYQDPEGAGKTGCFGQVYRLPWLDASSYPQDSNEQLCFIGW